MTLVDSSVWIDYFKGVRTPESELLDRMLGVQPLAIGDLIMTEVLQGINSDREFEAVRGQLANLAFLDVGGKEVSVQAAKNYRFLRSKGVTVRKTIDTLIATRCILDGIFLLYSDRDFDPFVTHLGLKSALP